MHSAPIKAAAANAGETLAEVAAAVGVAPGTLYQVSCGQRASWPSLRRRLADHFGIPEAHLFGSHANTTAR